MHVYCFEAPPLFGRWRAPWRAGYQLGFLAIPSFLFRNVAETDFVIASFQSSRTDFSRRRMSSFSTSKRLLLPLMLLLIAGLVLPVAFAQETTGGLQRSEEHTSELQS